jgi:hypothetical protein
LCTALEHVIVKITKGKYNVEDFGIYDLPAAPEFAQLFQ